MKTIYELNETDIIKAISQSLGTKEENVSLKIEESWIGPLEEQRVSTVIARVTLEGKVGLYE